jgi:thiamine-phosphate pyrophosphorylase
MIILKKFLFINELDTTLINKQDRNTSIIYRNYKSQTKPEIIKKIKNICKKRNIKFYLSNNIKLAIKLGLDGAYIPSFNRSKKHLSYSLKSNFLLIGSAHTNKEIKIKELQKVKVIFISSLFKKNKNFLGINKFKLLTILTNKKTVALGGINKKNIKKLNLIRCFGFAGISFFK